MPKVQDRDVVEGVVAVSANALARRYGQGVVKCVERQTVKVDVALE